LSTLSVQAQNDYNPYQDFNGDTSFPDYGIRIDKYWGEFQWFVHRADHSWQDKADAIHYSIEVVSFAFAADSARTENSSKRILTIPTQNQSGHNWYRYKPIKQVISGIGGSSINNTIDSS